MKAAELGIKAKFPAMLVAVAAISLTFIPRADAGTVGRDTGRAGPPRRDSRSRPEAPCTCTGRGTGAVSRGGITAPRGVVSECPVRPASQDRGRHPNWLFSPTTKIEATGWRTDNGKTRTQMCGISGAGCFNPRMVESPRGIWLQWFNSPGDKGRHANPDWVLSCAGPSGPCRNPHKPAIYGCNTGGDFSVSVEGATGFLVCAGANRIIGIEQLAAGDENGLNIFHGNISLGAAREWVYSTRQRDNMRRHFQAPMRVLLGHQSRRKRSRRGTDRIRHGCQPVRPLAL